MMEDHVYIKPSQLVWPLFGEAFRLNNELGKIHFYLKWSVIRKGKKNTKTKSSLGKF